MLFYKSLVAMMTGTVQNVGILGGGCEESAPFVACRDSIRSLKFVVWTWFTTYLYHNSWRYPIFTISYNLCSYHSLQL